MATVTVKMCDTEGCGSIHNVQTTQEGDFCGPCMEGIRYANEVQLAYTEMTPGQEWAEIQSDRYDMFMGEY